MFAIALQLFFYKGLACSRIILRFDYAVDYPVESVKSCYGYYPLLYYDYRGHGTKVLLKKYMTLSFEDLEYKETYMPDLSGPNDEVHKMPSFLINQEGFMSLLNTAFRATLVVFFLGAT